MNIRKFDAKRYRDNAEERKARIVVGVDGCDRRYKMC